MYKKVINLIIYFFTINLVYANSGNSRNDSALQFQLTGTGGSTGGASVGLSLGYHISKSFYFGVNSFPQYQSAEFNTLAMTTYHQVHKHQSVDQLSKPQYLLILKSLMK
mgnify:CR=1 FL=1